MINLIVDLVKLKQQLFKISPENNLLTARTFNPRGKQIFQESHSLFMVTREDRELFYFIDTIASITSKMWCLLKMSPFCSVLLNPLTGDFVTDSHLNGIFCIKVSVLPYELHISVDIVNLWPLRSHWEPRSMTQDKKCRCGSCSYKFGGFYAKCEYRLS